MAILPRWLLSSGYSDDESDSENSPQTEDEASYDSASFESSDEEELSRRMRQDGIYGLLPLSAQKLPAALRIPEIQQAVEQNRVVCVLGYTGCGKSTIVPFVLGQSENVRILCTQPRRMAAISLCEHLQMRFYGQRNHPSVGYRVRGSKTDTEESKIVYVTAGYLKTMLTHNPGELSQFTHLILDEVHERGIDSDFLSLMVKRLMLLPENSGVKLIVMSATLEAELFVRYFSALNDSEQPPKEVVLTDPVSGRKSRRSMHAIEEFFVEEVSGGEQVARFFETQIMPRADEAHGVIPGELSEPVQQMIVEIVLRNAKDGHSCLIFLPGLGEIYGMQDKLSDALYRAGHTVISDGAESPPLSSSYFHLFVLHSSMPYEEQKLALQEPAPRARHIVLCTNVAESSLTVPKVDIVIDSGLRKANSYDAKMGIFRLTSVWCSKASCMQRRGRTGRVCDGKYFRLFTRNFFETKMLKYDTPEVLLTDLSCVFLNAKYICEFWRQPDGMNRTVRPSTILQELITPPYMRSIKAAVEDLFEAGILRHEADEMSELSLLGTLATRLNVEPQIARIIFFGWLSGLVCEGLVLAAACQMDTDIIRSTTARSYVGKDDYCKNLYDFMWYRTGYDLGSLSEPIAARNLLWAWMSSHYGLKPNITMDAAPEYFSKATYAKEFDSFKRSVLNTCVHFANWVEEEIGDEHAREEAEVLKELLSERRRSVGPEAIRSTVFKCGRNFEKLKALLVVSMNTRLLTADALATEFDERHSIKFEKLSEALFLGCEEDVEKRKFRMAEIATKLTGRTPQSVHLLERGTAAMNTSWVVVPGKDYPLPEVATAPAADFNRVRDDYNLLPHRESEFFRMIMPISVRTCMQIFDRRYCVNVDFFPSGEVDYPVKAKIKLPQYSNAVKWGRIARSTGTRDSLWLPVTVNTKSPVGWLHRVDANLVREEKPDRLWGVAGKIVGTTKSMFEDQIPNEARASNVTVLPVAKGGRVAISLLLAALPLHAGGLVADVALSDSGDYEVLTVRLEGRIFNLNTSRQYPITSKVLGNISSVRRLVAKALDLPGTRKNEGGSLSIAPEVMMRIRQIQCGGQDDVSLSQAIDALLDVVYSETSTSDTLFGSRQPVARRIMLIPDSGHSYTEVITDPTLWVPPSIAERSFAKRMLFRKDQIAEIQYKLSTSAGLPRLNNHRDLQEAPIYRLSHLGFSVDEIHRYLERLPRFFQAGLSQETIMDDEIDEISIIAAREAWIDNETSFIHAYPDGAQEEEPVPSPSPIPVHAPLRMIDQSPVHDAPVIAELEDHENMNILAVSENTTWHYVEDGEITQDVHVPSQSSNSYRSTIDQQNAKSMNWLENAISDTNDSPESFGRCELEEPEVLKNMEPKHRLMTSWEEIEQESYDPYHKSMHPQDRLMKLWRLVNYVSLERARS
jgi:HrpA-like RNA helicase